MNNKTLILFLLTIISFSCEVSSEIEYTIFNQTDRTVKILGFDRDFDNPENSAKAEQIIIEPNSSFSVTKLAGFENTSSERFYSIQGVDSVKVIFNNEKILVLTLESTFNQGQTIFQGNENNQHFITQQDYEKAVDCNGNCE